MPRLHRGFSAPMKGTAPMEKPQKPTSPQVQVQIDPSQAEGIYANLVLLAHSSSEFILDFARLLPGIPRAKVYSRIIMTPQNARMLLRALQTRIDSYESQHGKIPDPGTSSHARDIGFTTDTP